MLNIIHFQKKRSLAEMLYMFTNTNAKREFQRKEFIILIIFIIFLLIKLSLTGLSKSSGALLYAFIINESIFVLMLVVFIYFMK